MMRTIEVILAIGIIFAAVLVTALYAKLPESQELSTPMLSQLGSSALSLLSTEGFLGQTIWSPENSSEWAKLQTALNILLPTDVVYNLTVYKTVVASEPVDVKGALNFNGLDAHVNISSWTSTPNSSMTVELWIYTAEQINGTYGYHKDIIRKGDEFGMSTQNVTFPSYQLQILLRHWCNSSGWWASTVTLTPNAWNHFAVVYEVSGFNIIVRLYVNGRFAGSVTRIIDWFPEPTSILKLGTGHAGFWKGAQDEVRIYERALSSTEILSHYMGIYSNETGLIMHLSLNGDISDKSGHGYDGVADGGYTWIQGRFAPYIDVSRYVPVRSLSNIVGQSSPKRRVTVSQTVLNPNLITSKAPAKVNATLYILNCSDANSWGLGGYTVKDLAAIFEEALSPYFQTVVTVASTTQLQSLFNGLPLAGEKIQDAVVLNTFGEAVPIPSYPDGLTTDYYMYYLGKKVAAYNWTWVSMVGYPFYYITNTTQTGWVEHGIYGVTKIGAAGFNAFLQGLSNKPYSSNDAEVNATLGSSQVSLTNSTVPIVDANATFFANKYSLYVQPYQTCTHAFSSSILDNYNLTIDLRYGYVLEPVYQGGGMYLPGANFIHVGDDGGVHGVFTALGLAYNPDPRVAVLALLMHYHPAVFELGYETTDMLRIVVLELGQLGAD